MAKASKEKVVSPTETTGKEIVKNNVLDNIPARYELADAKIEELKTQFSGITVYDEESFNVAKEAKKVLVPLRTGIEKKRVELKADALEYGRKVDAEAKRITALLEEIEDPITKQIDDWNDRKRIEAEKAENERIARAKELLQKLVDLGVQYNAVSEKHYYISTQNETLVDLSFDELKTLSESEADFLIENMQADFEIVKQQKAEADAAEAKRMADIEAQQKENEEKEKAQAAEAKRLADEKAEIENERFELRKEKLISLGFRSLFDDVLAFSNDIGEVSIQRGQIISANATDWANSVLHLSQQVNELKEQQESKDLAAKEKLEREAIEKAEKEAEEKRLSELFDERCHVMELTGFSQMVTGGMFIQSEHSKTQYIYDEIVAWTKDEFKQILESAKVELANISAIEAADKAAAEVAELARLNELATEKQKLQSFIDALKYLSVPDLKSKVGQPIAKNANDLKAKFIAYMEENLGKLK